MNRDDYRAAVAITQLAMAALLGHDSEPPLLEGFAEFGSRDNREPRIYAAIWTLTMSGASLPVGGGMSSK